MVSRRFLIRLISLALACLCLSGLTSCNSPQLGSPTLPLPPPEIGHDGERYVLSGTVPSPRANVFARNERTLLIFGEFTTSRRYSFAVDAVAGDYFTMWYAVELKQGPPILVEIPEIVTNVQGLTAPPDAGVPAPDAGL